MAGRRAAGATPDQATLQATLQTSHALLNTAALSLTIIFAIVTATLSPATLGAIRWLAIGAAATLVASMVSGTIASSAVIELLKSKDYRKTLQRSTFFQFLFLLLGTFLLVAAVVVRMVKT